MGNPERKTLREWIDDVMAVVIQWVGLPLGFMGAVWLIWKLFNLDNVR